MATMYEESLRAFLKPVIKWLDDPSISEIMINGPNEVWIESKGQVIRTEATFTEEGLLGAARNMAQFVGRMLNEERPRLDARLPDGSRIHVVLPPIARKGTTISIRKFFKDKLTPEMLVQFGSLTKEMVRVIEAAVVVKLNMLVSGGTGSGKTTLLNCLSSLVPSDERILTIEDAAELQLNQPHIVPFESRPPDKFGKGEVNMGHLLMSALRLRPDRIVVGEVRGGEAFDLVQAMNTGHGGSMATTHANTPTDSLRRIESLCLMAGIDLPMIAVRAQVASALNFIVCCERYHDGTRKTVHVAEVLPLSEKGDYRTQDIWLFTPVTKDDDGHLLGYHAPTGIIPSFVHKAHAYGFTEFTPEYFDPATYGVPPPPVVHGLGDEVQTHWAPSLKHREKNQKDPAEFADNYKAYSEKLRVDAREKKAAKARAAEASKPKGTPVAVPPPAAAAAPAAAAPKAAAPIGKASNDATPPPTRNPLLAKKPTPEPQAAHHDEEAPEDEQPPEDEAPDPALEQGTNIRSVPMPPPGKRPLNEGSEGGRLMPTDRRAVYEGKRPATDPGAPRAPGPAPTRPPSGRPLPPKK